jgi:hypothetical protein
MEGRKENAVAKVDLWHDAPPEVLGSIVRGLISRLKFGENLEAAYRLSQLYSPEETS